jgi:hypothetical protein
MIYKTPKEVIDYIKLCPVCKKPIGIMERANFIVHKECRSKWHWLKRKEKLNGKI